MEQSQIIAILISLCSGYGIAHFFKKLSYWYSRFGLLIGYFVFPAVFFGLLFLSVSIADQHDIVLSSAYALAFLFRFFSNDN